MARVVAMVVDPEGHTTYMYVGVPDDAVTPSKRQKRKLDDEDPSSDGLVSKRQKNKENREMCLTARLVNSKRRYEIQDLDFGSEQKADFQKAWLELVLDADARDKLDATTRKSYLCERTYSEQDITNEEKRQCQGQSPMIHVKCIADIS